MLLEQKIVNYFDRLDSRASVTLHFYPVFQVFISTDFETQLILRPCFKMPTEKKKRIQERCNLRYIHDRVASVVIIYTKKSSIAGQKIKGYFSNPRYTSSISSYAKDAIRYSWEKKTKLEKGYKEKQLKVTNNLKQFSSETTTRRILQRSLKKHLSQLLHTETNEYRIYRERNIRRTVEEDR